MGAVPDVFIFNCVGNPDEQTVKSYLEARSVAVTNIQKVSHQDARKHSFKVSLGSHEAYDKVMNKELLPRGTGVKIFKHRRERGDPWNSQRDQAR